MDRQLYSKSLFCLLILVVFSLSAIAQRGSISPSTQSIFSGGTASIISIGGPDISGYSYKWQRSSNNVDFYVISGETSTSYNPSGATQTWYYRVYFTSNSNGSTDVSPVASVLVSNHLAAGTTSPSSSTINYSTSPGQLSNSGATEGIGTLQYQWQQSSDGASFTDISGATAVNYTPSALTATTYYRLKATKGTETVYSNISQITVYPQLISGSLSPSSQNINYNTAFDTLRYSVPTGGSGSYSIVWQYSYNNSTWTTMNGTIGLMKWTAGQATQTTYFRVWTSSNGVDVYSNSVVVNVYPQLVSGSASAATSNVNYNTAATLSATTPSGGNSSFSYQWQISADNSSWSNVSGANALTYTTPNLTATRYYRLVTTSNGVSVTSNTVPVNVYPQLTTALSWSGNYINYNTSPGSITNTVSGGNGSYSYQWQKSTDNSIWQNISGATSQNFSPGAMTSTSYFRVNVTSNGVNVTSNSILVNVYPVLTAGNLSFATSDIIVGTSPGQITGTAATGGNGSYSYQWYSSTDGGTTWVTISGATSLNYTPPGLGVPTSFRRTVLSNGASSNSNTASFYVFDAIIPADLQPDTIVYSASLSLTSSEPRGGTGVYSYNWQSSNDAATWGNITGASSLSYQVPEITAKTFYRLKIISSSFTAYSDTVCVYMPLNSGTIGLNTATIASGGSVSLASLLAANGGLCSSYSYQYQSSQDNFAWSNIASTTISNITKVTWFRRLVQCGNSIVASNVVRVKIKDLTDTFTPDTTTAAVAGSQTSAVIASYTGYNSNNMNYERTRTIIKPGITDLTTANGLSNPNDVLQTTKFFDGLGNLIQTVEKQSTSNLTDLVSVNVYDGYGRENRKFLPYTDNLASGDFRLDADSKQPIYYKNLLGTREDYFYSDTVYENSPINRIIKSTAPGRSWTGNGIGRKSGNRTNTIYDSVLIWKIDPDSASLPLQKGFYKPGTLMVNEFIDENDNSIVEFKDRAGKLILTKEQVSDQLNAGLNGWNCTYQVYDYLDRLRFVVPPKAVELIKGNWTVTFAIANDVCYFYRYDMRSRPAVKKFPGADSVSIIYDKRDRKIAYRDGNLRQIGFWKFYYYDTQNREVLQALVSSQLSRQALSDSISRYAFNPVNPFPFIDTTIISKQVYTFYDGYAFPGAATYVVSDLSKPQGGSNQYVENLPGANSIMTRGLITGYREQIDYDGQFVMTTNYYNERARKIQATRDNTQGGKDIIYNLYNFKGELISTYLKHTNPKSTATPQVTLLTMYHRDRIGRIDTVRKQVNDDPVYSKVLSISTYNELEQIIQKRLGVSGSTQLETQNYEYNVRGWLRGINKSFVNSASSTSNWFGQEICYDYGFDGVQLNGNMAGQKWKGRGDRVSRSYGYNYDNLNRLLFANFNQQNPGASIWTKDKVDFTTSSLSYDAMGNLLSMKQMGMNGVVIQPVDSLRYGYLSNGNKLRFVTDKYNNPQSKLGDFKEIVGDTTQDYYYNGSGSLSKDNNKNIDTILYNHNNKVSTVWVKNKGKIFFQYRGGDEKISKLISDTSNGGKYQWIHYIGDFVYEAGADGVDTLKSIETEEGRIRPIYKAGSAVSYTFDYYVKDNQGNIRVVLGTKSDTAVYAATMETNASSVENALFSNIDNTRFAKPSYYPTDNTTNPNDYVSKLNANSNKIGPSIVLRVMAGDTISIACKALYKDNSASTSASTSSAMVSSILSAFSGGGIVDGVHYGTGVTAPISILTPGIYDNLKSKDPTENLSDKPKAYLNFALFDDQFNLVDENSGVRQVKGLKDSLNSLVVGKTAISKTGFIYIYLSNESAQDVLFDNLIVSHISGPLLEETHYYPHGGSLVGIGAKALKSNLYYGNKRRYNGKELQFNEMKDGSGTEWYDFGSRMYEYQIGRWNVQDPKIEKFYNYSPYVYNYNNPNNNLDPNGQEAYTLTGPAARAAFKMFQQVYNSAKYGRFIIHYVYQSETPGIYENTINAFKAGKSPWLTYDPSKTNKKDRRDIALYDYKRKAFMPEGYSWDEYPFACTMEGGKGSIVKAVPIAEQQRQGSDLGTAILMAHLKKGEHILVIPVADSQSTEAVPQADISGWMAIHVIESILSKFSPTIVLPPVMPEGNWPQSPVLQ